MRLSPGKVTQGATLARNRPSLSLRGAIGTAIRSAGFETTSPSIELFPASASRRATCPPLECASTNRGTVGQLAGGPCQYAREIADQVVVPLDHAPAAGAAAVAAVIDGDHVELEPARPAPRPRGGSSRRARQNRARRSRPPGAPAGATSGRAGSSHRRNGLRCREPTLCAVAICSLGIIVPSMLRAVRHASSAPEVTI